AKSEQQSLLDPRVYDPFAIRTSFRRTHFTTIECALQLIEHVPVCARKLIVSARGERLDLFTQRHANFPSVTRLQSKSRACDCASSPARERAADEGFLQSGPSRPGRL